MTTYKVLKDFSLSKDGARSVRLLAGSEADVPERFVTGLTDEGFIGPIFEFDPDPELETKPAADNLETGGPVPVDVSKPAAKKAAK